MLKILQNTLTIFLAVTLFTATPKTSVKHWYFGYEPRVTTTQVVSVKPPTLAVTVRFTIATIAHTFKHGKTA
jgi:hypothetical protein